MRYDTIAFILAVCATLAQLIVSYSHTGNDWILVSVSVVGFIIIGLLGSLVLANRFAQKLDASIASRLPQTEIYNNREEIAMALRRAATNANAFIYTTGSATRLPEYIRTIESKIDNGTVEYSRIFYRRHVHPELQEMSRKLIGKPNVELSRLEEDHYGYFTITEIEAIILLPGVAYSSPIAIRVTAPERVNQLRQQFEKMAVASQKIKTVDEFDQMVAEFQPHGG